MIRCKNCGLEFSLFTEQGYEMVFPGNESVRKTFKVCGHCEQESSCLEWVPQDSKVAQALSMAWSYHKGSDN